MHFDDRGTQENQTQSQHLSIFFIKDIIQWFNWKTQDRHTCPVREFTDLTLKSLAPVLRCSGYVDPCDRVLETGGINLLHTGSHLENTFISIIVTMFNSMTLWPFGPEIWTQRFWLGLGGKMDYWKVGQQPFWTRKWPLAFHFMKLRVAAFYHPMAPNQRLWVPSNDLICKWCHTL